MKVNIFKKLIKDIIREELDLKFAALDKKLDEVLVNKNNSYIVEDRAPQHNVSSPKKETQVSANTHIPLTKNSILNDILQETAHAGDWKTINEEAEVKSVTEDTAGLPDHLANALTKDYSGVMQKVEEKDNFKRGA